MTREEEILNDNEQLALKIAEELSEGSEFECDSLDIYKGAMKMADWKDQHPRKGLVDIEKVEKVLGNLLFNKEEKIYRAYLDYDAFFEDLHKAMEE